LKNLKPISTINSQTRKNSESIINTLKAKLASTTTEFREVLELRTENLKNQQKSRLEFTGSSFAHSYQQHYSDQSHDNHNGEVVISMPLQIQNQQDYTQSRLEAVQSIESTIVELEGIFQQLAIMVSEQGEMIERIDANIDQTTTNMNLAQTELLKYWAKLSNSRRLTMKIFLVLIVFVIVFVIFFV